MWMKLCVKMVAIGVIWSRLIRRRLCVEVLLFEIFNKRIILAMK